MLLDWSPTCETHPHTTSSTMSGSIPARSASALSTIADRSAACISDSPPLRLPTGVRTASTITVSRIHSLRSRYGPATTEHRVPLGCERRVRLLRVCGGEVSRLRPGLVCQCIAQCRARAVVEKCLALRQRDGRACRKPGGQVVDERVDLG